MEIEPTLYRLAARAMFAPFGGLESLRRRLLDALELKPGARVLELGCGPGDLTAQLLARGARVHAIDHSLEMLSVAAKEAPGAQLERADVRSFTSNERYDAVVIAFVLHELPAEDVKGVIERAAGALASGGRLAILDHAVPAGSGASVWRSILRGVESRKIDGWLGLDVPALVRGAGMQPYLREDLADGRAQLIVSTA
jgi:trans-aconitate methyltransferase